MMVARLGLPIGVTALALLALAVGSSFMPLDRVLAALFGLGSRPDEIILWNIRLPRICLAILAGTALAIAGALLQRATRNPLAAPSVLGVVDGAAVGVLVFFWAFSNEANALTVSVHWQPLAAALGAVVFASCVALLVARAIGSPMRLILYGVTLAALANAIVVLMIIAGSVYRASSALIWLAGSVHTADWRKVIVLAVALAAALPVLIWMLRPLDQLRLDDASAQATGLAVNPTRIAALILSVLLTAAAVSVLGGIGFVGLIAPPCCAFALWFAHGVPARRCGHDWHCDGSGRRPSGPCCVSAIRSPCRCDYGPGRCAVFSVSFDPPRTRTCLIL